MTKAGTFEQIAPLQAGMPAATRPEAPGPRLVRRLVIVAVWVAVGVFAAGRLLSDSAPAGVFGSVFDLLLIGFFVAAGAGALTGAAARAGRARLGWRLVASAWLISALAFLLALGAPKGEPAWLHAVSMAAYNSYYPLSVAGLLLLVRPGATADRQLRALLDVLLVAGASQLLVWRFALRGVPPEQILANLGHVLTNAVGELAVLASAAWLLASVVGRPEGSLRLLGAAAVAAALADLASLQLSFQSSVPVKQLSDCGLAVSAALVASAGLLHPGGRTDRHGRVPELVAGTLGHVPTLAVGVGMLLLVADAAALGGPPLVLAASAAGLTVLALLALAVARRQLEAEAERLARQADRLAAAQRLATVGHLAGSAAHDFNNLATAMQEIAAELRELMPGAPPLVAMEAVSTRAAGLCRRLLGMARGASSPAPAPHELGAAAMALRPLLLRLLPPGVSLEVEGGASAWAKVDLARLELALVNLVVNARDAIPGAGRIAVGTEPVTVGHGDVLSARGLAPGRYFKLSVRDTGAGMDAATLARVTEPYFTTKPVGQGTGLGLSLVSELAVSAGGQVLIESAPGAGTTVSLVLPACSPPGQAAG
ncbi:MAG: hypothetical protein IPQ24_17890 [Anaeromyxobacter sp.]|nr:hypothetical protein [Anaeromyxobacter sp.]